MTDRSDAARRAAIEAAARVDRDAPLRAIGVWPACPRCNSSGVVPASGPGTKGQLVMPCPQCTAKEGE